MKPGIGRVMLAVCGIGLCGLAALVQADEPSGVRVALVTLARGEVAQGVVDLATAELSAEARVEMLEREAIDAVLREQEWSLSGLVNAADAVRARQVLGADVLVVLQSLSAEQPLAVVAYDSVTGIRLMDEDLPTHDLERQARQLAGIGRQAIEKWRNSDEAIRTFSVLAIQNVDLPDGMGHLPGAIGCLLERQMIQSPDVTILERERLDVLNAERILTGEPGKNGLRASVHLLEMDISRALSNGHLRAFGRLSDAAGKPQGEFVATGPADAPVLAEAIQTELLWLLKAAPPPAPPAREAEAQRYRQEARIRFQHNQYELAIRAAEAAVALDPKDQEVLTDLVRYHFEQADNLYKEAGASYLLKQVHGLDLLKGIFNDTSLVSELGYFLFFRCPPTDSGHRRGWSPLPSQIEYKKMLATLQKEYARHLGLSLWEEVQGDAANRPLICSYEPRWALDGIAIAAPDSATYLRYLGDYVRWWMEAVESQPEENKDFRLSEAMRAMREMTTHAANDDCSWFVRNASYYTGLHSLFVEMAAHSVPYMSYYGQLGILFCEIKTERISPATALERVQSIDREVQARISSRAEGEENLRGLLYLFLLDLYDQVADLDERQLLIQGLFDFMLEQKTLVPAVGHAATVPYAGNRYNGIISEKQALSAKHYPRLILNAEHYLEVIQNRDQFYVYPNWEWIDREVQTTTKVLRRMREVLGSSTNSLPWSDAIQVMDLSAIAPELTRINQIHEEGGELYILASALGYRANSAIALFKSDLRGQAPIRIFSMVFGRMLSEVKRLGPMVRHRSSTYIPTYGAGVLVVSDDGSHHWINREAGLPSDHVHGIGVLQDAVYVATGEEGREAYWGRYDLEMGQWVLLAASNRREKAGPLDELPPFVIHGMQTDTVRNRVVFALDFEEYFMRQRVVRNEPAMSELGLWSYGPKNESFTQLLPLNRSPSWTQVQGERVFAVPWNHNSYADGEYNQRYGMVVFDFKANRGGIVYYSEKNSPGPDLAPTDAALYVPAQLQEPPYVVQRDGVWFARPTFGRHLFSGEIQFFPDAFPDQEQAKRVDHLALGSDGATLIAATDTQVWLFKRDPSVAMRDEDWKPFYSTDNSEERLP